MTALREECQDADILFGANSLIPLPVFQTIMKDYDLPIISADVDSLKQRGFLHVDSQKNNLVDYKGILNMVAPVATLSSKAVINAVILVQKMWKGYFARKSVARMRNESDALLSLKEQA